MFLRNFLSTLLFFQILLQFYSRAIANRPRYNRVFCNNLKHFFARPLFFAPYLKLLTEKKGQERAETRPLFRCKIWYLAKKKSGISQKRNYGPDEILTCIIVGGRKLFHSAIIESRLDYNKLSCAITTE